MGAFSLEFQQELQRESWALYTLGIVVIILRLYARARKLGVRHLEFDDCLMLLAAICYTILIVTLNFTARGGGTALALPGEDVFAFTEKEVKVRQKGAKIDLVVEQAMLNVIWILKVCTLRLYSRITMGLKQQIAVKILAGYVVIGWVAIQLTYFLECLPFKHYWQIAPSPSVNCMVFYDYAIVQAIFNISSDIFMLIIPFPLILQVSVTFKQKLILLVIFSMGIFVIIAATLTKAEFFISIYSEDYMFWYTREASVAVYVANLPCIWPLLREAMPVLKSWTPGFVSSHRRRGTSTGAFTAQGRTRDSQNPNMGLSRHSMDEFHAIVEQTASTTAAKRGTTINTSEVHSHVTNSRGSADSSRCEREFEGILAETTIEMSVMVPEPGNCKEGIALKSKRSSASSICVYAHANDLEQGHGPGP